MPKYWGKQIFSLGSFPEVGQKQKTERKERKRREKERLKDSNNNGQATHCKRHLGWRTQSHLGQKTTKMITTYHTLWHDLHKMSCMICNMLLSLGY